MKYRRLNLDAYPRRAHFDYFRTLADPYVGVTVDVDKVNVSFRSAAGEVEVCRNGAGVPFSEEEAARVLHEKEIHILVGLGDGDAASTAWGCDLTYDYVKINGDYRT